jgi:hypothetical protein
VIFTTAITKDYLWRAAPLLASLYRFGGDCRVVTVGFHNMPAGRGYCTHAMESNQACNQAGQVLDVLELDDGALLIQADADAVIQRDLDAAERELLGRLDSKSIAMGFNRVGPESGAEEYQLLSPHRSVEEVNQRLGVDLAQVAVYNAGFIAARVAVWRELRKWYDVMYAAGNHLFGNWRCCQLLLCCAIWHLGLHVIELPRTLHAHQHFGPHPDDQVVEGKLLVRGELAFYAHHVPELGLVGA